MPDLTEPDLAPDQPATLPPDAPADRPAPARPGTPARNPLPIVDIEDEEDDAKGG